MWRKAMSKMKWYKSSEQRRRRLQQDETRWEGIRFSCCRTLLHHRPTRRLSLLLTCPTLIIFSTERCVFQASYSDCQHQAMIYGRSLCKGNNLKRRELCLRFLGCGWSHTSTAVKQSFFFGRCVPADLTDWLFWQLEAKRTCSVCVAIYKAPGSNCWQAGHKQIKMSIPK